MNKLVVIAGPTAVGKSDLAVKLAKRIDGEIISADSMQVYRRMDIGSAKVTKEEMQGIPHHMIDVLDPSEEFNAFLFTKTASKLIEEINAKGKIPIVTGGTGFYIRALIYGNDFSESNGSNEEILKELDELAAKDPGLLYEELKKVDPESASIIHKNNIKRVTRALMFYKETGRKISEHNSEMHEKPAAYDFACFVVTDDRAKLYERIDKRVDKMLKAGLVEEVRSLAAEGLTKDNISMQGIGYKELLMWLEGELSFDEAVSLIKQSSRHYAKRQITWFKREKEAIWLDRSTLLSDDKILDQMIDVLKEKGII